MDFPLLFKDPEKKIRTLVKKITHSGDMDLDKQHVKELKDICKATKDEFTVRIFKECMKCLRKEHSQVRVTTVKLIDYLFQKSHIIREKLLDTFDIFLELTLAISQRSKVKLKLPPPKKYANLLQELTAKLINTWHSEFGCGYEKIRYIHRFLREHQLVDFSHYRVRTHEELIKRQKLAEKQDKILTRSIENRLKEFQEMKPEIEQLIVQIESLLDLLIPVSDNFIQNEVSFSSTTIDDETVEKTQQQHHGIVDLSQNIEIEFSPYFEIQRNRENKDVVLNLKELKKQLVDSKMTKLISIEKTLNKRSEQFLNILKEIIDLKNKSMSIVLKLSELKIVNNLDEGTCKNSSTLDNVDSGSETDSDFEEVRQKEDLETYIPKNMRFEYGLEPINPKELESSSKVTLINESFDDSSAACSSSSGLAPIMACNVRLESGKLCPRKDKIKCPFHGKIIPRDQKGIPMNETDRLYEEAKSKALSVPEWQDPELLLDIRAATGIDLIMPLKGKSKTLNKKKLANIKTCDLTPKQRLQKRLRFLNK